MSALIEAEHLTRVLPAVVPVTLVRDVTVVIRQREFVAITGTSGSGKSSLLYLLGLLDQPTSGALRIAGEDALAMSERQRARLRLATLGFVFQFHFLLPEFSVRQNVEIPMRKLGRLSSGQRRERASHLLESLGLAGHLDKRPDQLSGGQRQRVAVARARQRPAARARRRADRQPRLEKLGAGVRDPRRLVRKRGKTVVAVTTMPRWRRAWTGGCS